MRPTLGVPAAVLLAWACQGDDVRDTAFLDPPPRTACDAAAQDCPAGDKCTPLFPETTGPVEFHCADVIGERQVGDDCTRTADNDDCAAGLVCLSVGTELPTEGVCAELCGVWIEDPCAQLGADWNTCLQVTPDGIGVCVERCDPLAEGCPDGFGCVPVSDDPFDCLPLADPVGAGEPCAYPNACEPGLLCAPAPDGFECTAYCEAEGDGTECATEQECFPFFEEGQAPADLEDVGVCLDPEVTR